MKARKDRGFLINNIIDIAISICILLSITGICYLLDYYKINDLNFISLYIFGVLISTVFIKQIIYPILTSIAGVLIYNFCFTEPRMSLKVNDINYLVTFVIMVVIGATISIIMYLWQKNIEENNRLSMEKKEIEAEADKETMRATLLRSVSHDLRTPLTAINNGVELLTSSTHLSDEEKSEILENMHNKTTWMIRLVENLLSLTKIKGVETKLKKEKEAIEEIIPQAIRNVSSIIGNIKLKIDIPEELLLVPMDATLIIQVITNILSNAIKHCNDDSTIRIKVFNTNENCVFRIYNDGEKISKEVLDHIFELYYTSADMNGGVGVGLPICKMIVEAHKGKIDIRNTEEGVVVEFSLPMEQNE